jgi:hypothetical protein
VRIAFTAPILNKSALCAAGEENGIAKAESTLKNSPTKRAKGIYLSDFPS